MEERLKTAVYWLEVVAAALLVALAAVALVAAGATLVEGFTDSDSLLSGEFVIDVVDGILVFFIVIELFRIALAYIRRSSVVTTVLEAALVAVARKMVILFEVDTGVLEKSIALGVLTLAIGVTWFLLARADVDHET